MTSRIAVPVAAACAALLSMLSAPVQAQAPEKFTFALNWFAVGDHAAYYVALDKGYYTQRGLDVTIENSKGSGDSIAKVDTGRADAGLADAVPIISAVSRGARVKMVGMVFDKTPMTFFSRTDAPLTKPADLEGKTVGAPAGDSQRLAFPAFARLNKIDPNKVTWVNIEPTAKVASIAEKRMDGVADYTTGLPFYDKAMGEGKVARLAWADYGFDLYAMSIHGRREDHERPAEAAQGLPRGLVHGLARRDGEPEGSVGDLQEARARDRRRDHRGHMLLGFELMRTKGYADNGIGYIDEKKMCGSTEIVNTYMGLPKKVECKAVYTSEYFTKVAMPLTVK